MSANPLDQKARQLLHDYEAAPPPHAWAGIAALLPAEERRRPWFWLWFLLGAGAIAAAGWFIAPSFLEDPASASAIPTQNADPRTLRGSGVDAAVTVSSILPAEPASEEAKLGDLAPSASSIETSDFPSYPMRGQSPVATPQQGPTPRGGADAEATSAKDTEGSLQPATPRELELRPDDQSVPSLLKAQALATPSTLSARDFPLLQLRRHLGPLPCEDFKSGRNWGWGLRGFVGPAVVSQNLEDPTNSLYSYLRHRDTIEEVRVSPVAGARMEFYHRSGLFARVGLDYSMYRSEVEFLGPVEERTSIVTVTNPDGSVRSDTLFERIRPPAYSSNRHHIIAPVAGLGFRQNVGNWMPYVFGEVGFELSVNARGNLPDTGELMIDLNTPAGDKWLGNPGMQAGGGIGVDYYLNNGMAVGLSSRFLQLGDPLGDADPLLARRTRWSFGANLVWRMR